MRLAAGAANAAFSGGARTSARGRGGGGGVPGTTMDEAAGGSGAPRRGDDVLPPPPSRFGDAPRGRSIAAVAAHATCDARALAAPSSRKSARTAAGKSETMGLRPCSRVNVAAHCRHRSASASPPSEAMTASTSKFKTHASRAGHGRAIT